MTAEKNTPEIDCRIQLRDLDFFYKVSWRKGKAGIDELFRNWEHRLSGDDCSLAFFGKWLGRTAYASTWFDPDGGLSHLSIAWMERVLTAEAIEGLKRESMNIEKPSRLLDFYHSPRQGLVMLLSGAGEMLLEENFFAPSHPVTYKVASCFKQLESRREFIQSFNLLGSLRKHGKGRMEKTGTGFHDAAQPTGTQFGKIISLKEAWGNGLQVKSTPGRDAPVKTYQAAQGNKQ